MEKYSINLIYKDYSSSWITVECEACADVLMIARGITQASTAIIRVVVIDSNDEPIACYC